MNAMTAAHRSIAGWLVLGLASVGLWGCSTMKPEDFADRTPSFALEEYFDGDTRAWGIFEDRFGRLRREFVVDITGQWQPELQTLTLDESFRYSDGERDRRVWTLRKVDDHAWEGTAADVIGKSDARVYGNALNMTYTLALKVGERTWNVRFDDWM